MNGGPAVRRVHRQWEEEAGRRPYWVEFPARPPFERRAAWAARGTRLETPPAGPGMATATPVPVRAARLVIGPGPWYGVDISASYKPEPPFPLSLAWILGLNLGRDALVVDGKVAWLTPEGRPDSGGPAEAVVECGRARYAAHFCVTLDGLVRRAAARRADPLREWTAGGRHRACAQLDQTGSPSPTENGDDVAAFVDQRLIPHLEGLASARCDAGQVDEPPGGGEVVLGTLQESFLFLGGQWTQLVPFFGEPSHGRPLLRLADQCLVGVEWERASTAVARYDAVLMDAVRSAFTSSRGDDSARTELYRDGTYGIIRTPLGRLYLSQQISPYVLQGSDRRLYYFDGAEIGIPLTGTQSQDVIGRVCCQLLHPYRHMFVGHYGGGTFICMPRDLRYFAQLHALPLEQALLHHLESARMTLCAGYLPSNHAQHRVRATGRRTISLREARRRRLPIYWFQRPHPGLRRGNVDPSH